MSELLELTDVSKRYRRGSQELQVLQEASLEVNAGEVVCVLGMRGGGKTTLLRIAAGIETADSGLVCFDGQDLAALPDRQLSRLLGEKIAWAGKSGPGVPMRMLDYVAMPLLIGRARRGHRESRRTVEGRARAALKQVGALGCAEQQWESISDWERALVEIAQAIAHDPALLLVDDLTDSLGMRETDELTALLRSLTRESKMGVLMSVSDGAATLWSDRIMSLSGGKLMHGPERASANVIEFPDLSARRDTQRGGGIS